MDPIHSRIAGAEQIVGRIILGPSMSWSLVHAGCKMFDRVGPSSLKERLRMFSIPFLPVLAYAMARCSSFPEGYAWYGGERRCWSACVVYVVCFRPRPCENKDCERLRKSSTNVLID